MTQHTAHGHLSWEVSPLETYEAGQALRSARLPPIQPSRWAQAHNFSEEDMWVSPHRESTLGGRGWGRAWPCRIDTIHHVDETGPQVKSIILKEDFCFQNVSYQVYAIVALGFPGGSEGKESACNEGDQGSIPGSGRLPGKENGYPLRYSCLENSTDRGGWWATVHGVTEGRTQ